MLEKEYAYYQNNKKTLLKEYRGKFLVIKDEKVQNTFENEKEAYQYAVANFELGKFLIQQCLPTNEEVVQTFHSRVIFIGKHKDGY